MSTDPIAGRSLAIVHVTSFYPPYNFGGDGVHVQRLAQAQARRGHRVEVIHAPAAHALLRGASPAPVGDAAADGVRVHAVGGARGALEAVLIHQFGRPVLSRRRLRRLLGDAGGDAPDVVHFHNVSLVGGVGVLAMGERSCRLFTPHEYWAMCATHLLFRYHRAPCTQRTCIRCTLHARRPPQWWRYFSAPAAALRHVDRILYPSELTRSVYRQHGVDRPSVVWHHFLPDSYAADARARGARRSAEPYFLYAGRLDAVKGVEPMLQAFTDGGAPAPVWLAGQGPLLGHLRSRYGDHPAVRFLGQLDAASLGRLYRDAIAVVLPSAGYEVFGQVVVEGFAHGTPAIVSSVGGAEELIRVSGAGFSYRSPQALLDSAARLAADVGLRDRLGAAGREYVVRELNEAAYLDRYEALVQEVQCA